jgi:hypothetical protein
MRTMDKLLPSMCFQSIPDALSLSLFAFIKGVVGVEVCN